MSSTIQFIDMFILIQMIKIISLNALTTAFGNVNMKKNLYMSVIIGQNKFFQ